MEIKPSDLLSPTTKLINFSDCKLIATEGPNMMGSVNLAGLNIPYDSYATSKILLPKNREIPLMYGSLGTNVTLIGIFPKFTSTNPQCCTEEDKYIQFWFEDHPSIIYYTTYGFFLATNSDHKIAQLYMKNTTDLTVVVECIVADVGEVEISEYLSAIDNLYWNSIISDYIIGYDYTGGTYSGSTELKIYDEESSLVLVISYDKISAIQKADSLLTLITATDDIELEFINDYNSYQAYSRIYWVMEQDISGTIVSHRYMTFDDPGLDNAPPVISLYTGATYTGYTYTGGTITPTNLINYYVSGVTDYDDAGLVRDGVINKLNGTLTIREEGSLVPITGITTEGEYNIVIQYTDLANNIRTQQEDLIIDITGPVFTLKNTATVLNFCTLAEGCATHYSAMTYTQLKTNYISNCVDNVDGTIAIGNVGVSITSGSTTFSSITYIGDYYLAFTASDRCHNSTTTGFTAHIRETQLASNIGIVFASGYTGTTIYVPSAFVVSASTFIAEVISGITDTYEPTLLPSDVVITTALDAAPTYPLTDGDYKFTITNTSNCSGVTLKTLDVI